MKPTRIAVFAKAPIPGFAKTRLIPALGDVGAALLAQALLAHAVHEAWSAAVGPVTLFVTPGPKHPAWSQWQARFSGAVSEWRDQGTGDLGQRLARAAASVVTKESTVLLIGTDCPALDRDQLRTAAQALERHPAVLIPSTDGGYVLLGLARFHPSIFQAIDWSSAVVAEQTRARLAALGWDWLELPPLSDIDRAEDLAALPPELARVLEKDNSSPSRAPGAARRRPIEHDPPRRAR